MYVFARKVSSINRDPVEILIVLISQTKQRFPQRTQISPANHHITPREPKKIPS
jgi:hypothetical protein